MMAAQIDLSHGPQPYITSDADAAAAKEMAQRRREQQPVPVSAPAHLIDRMWDRGQFNDRQHDTAVRLYGLFVRAGMEPHVTTELGERLSKAIEMPDDVADAHADFNRILTMVGGHRGQMLHAMCLGDHPGVKWLATLQGALGDVEKPLAKLSKQRGEKA